MTGSAPALVPPDPRPDPGLPRWVLPVALFGLAILLVSTLPALVARRRLERAEKALLDQSRSMDEATERVNRDRRALQVERVGQTLRQGRGGGHWIHGTPSKTKMLTRR